MAGVSGLLATGQPVYETLVYKSWVYTVNEWVKKSIEQMTEEKYIWNWSTERQESQQLENKTIWNIRYLI